MKLVTTVYGSEKSCSNHQCFLINVLIHVMTCECPNNLLGLVGLRVIYPIDVSHRIL